jgi:hypothetical protein
MAIGETVRRKEEKFIVNTKERNIRIGSRCIRLAKAIHAKISAKRGYKRPDRMARKLLHKSANYTYCNNTAL